MALNLSQKGCMSTTRSLTIGRFPIAEITGTCPDLAMSRTSSSVTHSGASTSYCSSLRSPDSGSTRQILSATSIVSSRGCVAASNSVLPFLGLPLGDRDRLPVEDGLAVLQRHDRVLEVVDVVAVRVVVRTRV